MIVGTGEIAGSIATGPFVVNEGIVRPGEGLATLTIADDFQQLATGRLQMEIAGGDTLSNDLLAINGTAMLAGTLEATLVGEVALSLHDSFTLLTASDGITGTFENLLMPTLADDLFWYVQYAGGEVRASVEEVIPGDFNRDGTADAADYVLWRKAGGTGSLSDWQTNFGESVPEESTPASTVPEPSAVTALLLSFLMTVAHNRGRVSTAGRV
jgi:hypothetical protein